MAAKITADSQEIIQRSELRYVSDENPGYSRRRCGRGFIYLSVRRQRLICKRKLARIQSLVIPPAWRNVWICPDPKGHLQATGFDKKGRKQYLYHPAWQELVREVRFESLVEFAHDLPRLRRRMRQNLKRPGFDKSKVVACALQILDKGHLRVGNEAYRRRNQSYGLTTLLKRHVRVRGKDVWFHFKGKKGKIRDVHLGDESVAQVIARVKEIPGEHLFSCYDSSGDIIDLHSEDVNEEMKSLTGGAWTAKDFRTWWGSVIAYSILRAQSPHSSITKRKRQVVDAIKEVSSDLGNTPAVCRKYYIHPRILSEFMNGNDLNPRRPRSVQGLRKDESDLLQFLAEP